MEDSCSKITSNFTFTANDSDTQCCLISQTEASDISNYFCCDFFLPQKVLVICECSPTKKVARCKKHYLGDD